MSELPNTHKEAIRWLLDRGREGVIDQYGRVVAQGERYKSTETAAVWLRLFTTEHIESAGRNRLKLTLQGEMDARAVPGSEGDFAFAGSKHSGPRMIDDGTDEFA